MQIKYVLSLAGLMAFGSVQAQENARKDSFAIGLDFPSQTVVRSAQLNGEDRSIVVIKKADKNKTFRGVVESYGLFDLMISYYDSSQKKILVTTVPLFIVPGYTEIDFDVNNPVIKINGVSAAPRFEYAMMMQDDQAYVEQGQELQNELEGYIQKGDKEQISKTKEKIEKTQQARLKNVYAGYIHRSPKTAVALYAMGLYSMIDDANPLEVEALLNSMPVSQQNNARMIPVRKRIEKNKTTMVGVMAPEFTQADTTGHPLALKSLQGNWVLLDFWASWCHPCRDQNPALVKLYSKFKNKGFTILSVSLDSKKDSWLTAIRHDKLDWKHVSDLHFWNNEVALLYGISSVPQNFLLDPQGKIVAKNLHPEDLETALDEAYGNSTSK